ncbi:MAG TPA: TfoX/Sxy family protein [Dehalococcoidia bacterium]|nr:TfoX/Sxy family protein [Dehalococcoidia bacterium]
MVAAFGAALPEHPAIERRQMFGYPAAFVGGNLVAGVFQDRVMVRLPEDTLRALFAGSEADPFAPMPGRPMKSYALLLAATVADPAALRGWLERALEHGLSLPAKAPKPRVAKATKRMKTA